jgi:AcrR family transcriptional regulator
VLRLGGHGRHGRRAEPSLIRRPKLLAGEDLLPEPRQQRSLEKRARLEAAGLALFGEKGYEGTSIEEIARRARLAVGGFYQHYRSKRQLLLALMDQLLEGLERLDLRPASMADRRAGIRDLLRGAFARDLRFLGAYRAWQEAVRADPVLARLNESVHRWTTQRVVGVFGLLARMPGARPQVDVSGLARVMDTMFWSLLADASRLSDAELSRRIDALTHLIYHGIFADRRGRSRASS